MDRQRERLELFRKRLYCHVGCDSLGTPMLEPPLNYFKSVFAHKFFVAPSDRNYFFARFAKTYGINEEFWWQALQTIEKLLKADLILNGVSVKSGYNHDIEKLWNKHKTVFGDLAVTSRRKPDKLAEQLWTDRTLESFIARVNQMGHPDSRYGLISQAQALLLFASWAQCSFSHSVISSPQSCGAVTATQASI